MNQPGLPGRCFVFSHCVAAVSPCVRARREFAPAGDPLSLLVQRKWAKKAPENPSGCHQCVSAARSAAVLTQQLAARRLKQRVRGVELRLVPRPRGDHRSTWRQCGSFTAAGHTLLFNGAVKYASVYGDMRPQSKVALFEPRGELLRKHGRGAGSRHALVTPRWKLEVLWYPPNFAARSERIPPSGPLLPFFAPAKKGSRRPGRIPGGLSRSEKEQHATAAHNKQTRPPRKTGSCDEGGALRHGEPR
jgi:hypothetical protein